MKTVTTSVGFQDALGNLILGGNLVLTLSQAAEVTSGGGLIAPKVVVLPLNATTAKIASTQIWFNDELTPTGTTYHSELLDSGGNIIADFGQWSITGASADLSTMVPTTIGGPSAAGVVLLNPGAGTQTISTGNLAVTNNQTIGGTLGVTGASTFSTGAFSNTGVFTNTQMNEYHTSLLNSAVLQTEFQAAQGGTNFATEGIAAGVVVPNTATVFQSNATSGYIRNISTTTSAVAGYFQARAGANNVKVWGLNPVAMDGSFTGTTTTGMEVDVNANAVSTVAQGITVQGSWTAQPTTSNGVRIVPPAGGFKWGAGFVTDDSSATNGLGIGALGPTSASSQTITLTGRDGGSVARSATLQANSSGNITITPDPNVGGVVILAGVVQQSGKTSLYNGISTTGNGVASVYGSTSQKNETGADASVLSFTPPAAVGSYRIRISMDVSAQNTATLGWTATWTDSNGSAQAPTNLSLFTSGTAAPALTVTAATNGHYYGYIDVDTNNAGTAIVVKTTFTGTSIAYKVSATVERLI